MEGTMRAMQLVAPGKFELKEVPIPKCGPDQVLIKVIYAGVCGSDFGAYTSGYMIDEFPRIIGHESCGEVVEIGENLVGPLAGMNVHVGSKVFGTTIGLGVYKDGCFAEYFICDEIFSAGVVVGVPGAKNDLENALLEPLCNSSVWSGKPGTQDGMKIFISGAGIQALAILQQLRYRYKDLDIAISDFSEYRLGLAKKFGADHIINLNEVKDPFQYLADIWGTTKIPYWVGDRDSGNADIVYECSGSTAGYELAFDVVKPKGKICCIGITKGNISIHPNYFLLKEVEPLGGLTGNPMLSVADVRAGVLSPIDYISQVFPLEELDKAFQVAMNPKVSMKVVVKVDPTAPDYPYNAVAYE